MPIKRFPKHPPMKSVMKYCQRTVVTRIPTGIGVHLRLYLKRQKRLQMVVLFTRLAVI
jgi:hypothetical protein